MLRRRRGQASLSMRSAAITARRTCFFTSTSRVDKAWMLSTPRLPKQPVSCLLLAASKHCDDVVWSERKKKRKKKSHVCLKTMNKNAKLLILICFLCFCRWFGVLLFTSGFFLTRYSLTTTNTCLDHNADNSNNQKAWSTVRFLFKVYIIDD